MSEKQKRRGAALALGLLLVAALAVPSLAQKRFLLLARSIYRIPERNAKCHLCHVEGKGPKRETLNDFGKALAAHADIKPALGHKSSHNFTHEELLGVAKALAALEGEDADKDGVTNKEEMELGSKPGDAGDKPDERLLAQYREAMKIMEERKKAEEAKKK